MCRSVTGNVLAVSSGDQRVTMYKQDLGGKWVEWHWQKADTGRWEVRSYTSARTWDENAVASSRH